MTKTVFITGCSSGIGLASSKLFFKHGWNVVATMRAPEKDTELKALGTPRMLVLRLDVQDLPSITAAVDVAIAKFGSIDLLINNAGYGQLGVFEMASREQVRAQFDVNVFGVMDVTRAVLPHLRTHKNGGIVMISSGGGLFALPVFSLYCASKFALEGFTESLSHELGPLGIFVKSIIPHSGVSATAFGERAQAASAADPTLAHDYDSLLQKTTAAYAKMFSNITTSSEDVAEVVYAAATDGTDKLRYLVGDDAAGLIKARYNTTTDEEYMAHVRSIFH